MTADLQVVEAIGEALRASWPPSLLLSQAARIAGRDGHLRRKEPADLADARRRADAGDERAARYVQRWTEADEARGRIAAVMASAHVAEVERTVERRVSVGGRMVDEVVVVSEDGRSEDVRRLREERRAAESAADAVLHAEEERWAVPASVLADVEDEEVQAAVAAWLAGPGRGRAAALEDARSAQVAAYAAAADAEERELGKLRMAVTAVDLVREETGEVATVRMDGRPLRADWLADPQRYARSLMLCESAAGVHRRADGTHGHHPLGCKGALCPLCVRRKAADRVARWLPVVLHLVSRGYHVVHLTATQPVGQVAPEERAPVVLTPGERGRHVGGWEAAAVDDGRSVSGEPLADALDRWRRAWDGMRYGRAVLPEVGEESREFFTSTVAGYLYGVEWTARKCMGGSSCAACSGVKGAEHTGPWLPRWHVHGHALVILRPEVPVDVVETERGPRIAGPWWDAWVARWCELTGGDPAAQAAVPVALGGEDADADEVERALCEVLKYPFKPAEMTAAQLVDCLATTKGRRFHLPGGALHASSRVGKAARALAAEEPADLSKLSAYDVHLARDLADAFILRDIEEQEERVGILYRPRESRTRRPVEVEPSPGLVESLCREDSRWAVGPAVEPSGRVPAPRRVLANPLKLAATTEAEDARHVIEAHGVEWVPLLLSEVAALYRESRDEDTAGRVLLYYPGRRGHPPEVSRPGAVGAARLLREVSTWRPSGAAPG